MSASAEYAAEVLQATLASISTKDLVDELAKRDNVHSCHVEKYGSTLSEEGVPATILAVID